MNFYMFLPKLLNMSLTGAIAIICVLLLRLLLKRAPKVISYALWIVVLFRLLCPVSITSNLSLFGLLDAPSTNTATGTSSLEYVPENIVHTEFPEVAIPVPGVSETINNTLPQGQEQLTADPLEAPVAIGTYVWLFGVMGMAVYSVISYVRLKRKLLIASPLQKNIWLADEIPTPFVMGLIRPRIYLPSDTEERQMPYLILHEKHHIRRGDHIFKALAFLALSLHWFNPLVWVAFIYANKDMEMSCDEAVVKKLGDHILADYTASLLSLATGKTIIAGVPLAFGEGDTKGRIRNLSHWKKPAFVVVLVAVIACVVLGVGLLTNPEKENASEDNEDRYYLLIGAEGVESIEVATANTSGGVENADGSAFREGEKVWLEQLQGVTDLRGVTITAFGAEGEILYAFSVPENASAEVVADIIGSDPWLLVPTTFEVSEDDGVEENVPAVAKWTFSPMMSANWHAAFHFEFGLEHYTHIEATCDNGKLWNLQAQGQPRENEMRFEQGEPLCWTPEIEGENFTYVAGSAFISFTVYDGEEVVSRGALDIVKTGEEGGQSFYEAQLTDTELLALWQEEGSNSAHVIMARNGSVVSYSDLNHNRINERIIVREVEPKMLYELLVVENGSVIWSVEAGLPHAGWNTFMLYNEDGKDYLVEYQPQMYQGVGTYKCKMYSLENDKETIQKEWTVDFELPAEDTLKITSEMELFAEEVGLLLRNCGVLLSTEQGKIVRQYANATELPQIYPVRFDPDEIQAAMDGTDSRKELTSNAVGFPDVPLNLVFASGAGAWGSLLTLQPDGSFIGDYRDSEMGSNASDYPNGTCYVSVFEGQFTDIQQISDYSWSMKLEELSTEKDPEETWIEDGVRYIASDAYGVTGGEEFILYAPGTPADDLTAECRNWWPDAYHWRNGKLDQLEGWALYNVNTGQGFFTRWMYESSEENAELMVDPVASEASDELPDEEAFVVKNILTGESKPFSADDGLALADILESDSWNIEGTTDCFSNIEIVINGVTYKYHSDCGTFNDNGNQRHLSLDAKTNNAVNAILDDYVSLTATEVPIE